jgi:F0F1-type ATP synthase assembly protein I
MNTRPESAAATDALRAEVRFLALLLAIFAGINIALCSLAYLSALAARGGVDASGGQSFYWLPQLLYYTLFFAVALRMRRFETGSRGAMLSIGAGRQDPAMAIAIKLRQLFVAGDVWNLVFPILAIVWLRKPGVRGLFA